MRFVALLALAGCSAEHSTCLDLDGDKACDGAAVDWSRGAPIDEPRENLYDLSPEHLEQARLRGLEHALVWPVSVTGMLLPYNGLANLMDPEREDLRGVQQAARMSLGFGTLTELYDWLGVPPFNDRELGPAYDLPSPDGVADRRVGAGLQTTELGDGLSFSCATCHTGRLLGRTVVGLTNRQVRANALFDLAKQSAGIFASDAFLAIDAFSPDDHTMMADTLAHLEHVATKTPQALGLDTSLAQVGLSLARRGDDPWATPGVDLPGTNALAHTVTDSKPAVWWTLKHKNRWLSDGSIVSGNPIFTNFLWNELGRGTDLQALQLWLEDNQDLVDELTIAAFATTPPRWTDFFPADSISEDRAREGQVLFDATCASCHGTYEKGWDAADADDRSAAERLATVRVDYPSQTQVLDVGTDLARARGMVHFADRLNQLAMSEWMGTVVEVQEGYVPPPLDGIWARYPYLHHGTVPTLCDLLLPAEERRDTFWQGPSENAADFDAECVGYPADTPESWKAPDAKIDTSKEGLSNAGHDSWRFTDAERMALVEYLKTL